MRPTWRQRHSAQMDRLIELQRMARVFATSADRIDDLAAAALDYAEAVRALAGTERAR